MQLERKVMVKPPKTFRGELKGFELYHERDRKLLQDFKQKSDVTRLASNHGGFYREKFFQNSNKLKHIKTCSHEKKLTSMYFLN